MRNNAKQTPESVHVTSRHNTYSSFNTQRFERVIHPPNINPADLAPTLEPNRHSVAEAERYIHDERTRGILTQERLSKQVDDLVMKDLKGAQLIRELEGK